MKEKVCGKAGMMSQAVLCGNGRRKWKFWKNRAKNVEKEKKVL